MTSAALCHKAQGVETLVFTLDSLELEASTGHARHQQRGGPASATSSSADAAELRAPYSLKVYLPEVYSTSGRSEPTSSRREESQKHREAGISNVTKGHGAEADILERERPYGGPQAFGQGTTAPPLAGSLHADRVNLLLIAKHADVSAISPQGLQNSPFALSDQFVVLDFSGELRLSDVEPTLRDWARLAPRHAGRPTILGLVDYFRKPFSRDEEERAAVLGLVLASLPPSLLEAPRAHLRDTLLRYSRRRFGME